MTLLIACALVFLAGVAIGYLLGDIGGERRAYARFTEANRSPYRRRR